jgi:hypothetical protein
MLSQKKGLECWGSEMVVLLSKFFVGFITRLDCQDFNWMPGNPSDKRFMYEVGAFRYYLTIFVFCVLSTLSFTHLSHAASSVLHFRSWDLEE